MSTGRNTPHEQLGTIPDNFIVRHQVPQLEILQQVDVFVTHGGMNSVHEGLYYGVPQLVAPSHFEQYLNGKAGDGGGGLAYCSVMGVDFGQASANELADGVSALLNDPSYRVRAQGNRPNAGKCRRFSSGGRRSRTIFERCLIVPISYSLQKKRKYFPNLHTVLFA